MLAEANIKKLEKVSLAHPVEKFELEDGVKLSRREYSVNSINKDDRIYIRVTGEEKEKLQAASARKGITMSRLIMQLLEAAYF